MSKSNAIQKLKLEDLEALQLYGNPSAEGALTLKVGKTPPPAAPAR